MKPSPDESKAAAAGQLHTSIALIMLGVVAGTCLLLAGMANSRTLQDWMRRICWEESKVKKQLPYYCFTGHFIDYEERFLHEEIPSIDYSHGGVYFFGASTMKWALKTWELPAEARPFIHNFAFGGSKHSDQADFLRFLVQEEGLLKAGAEKTLIVLGTNYRLIHHGRLGGEGPGEYFREIWTRHGFYTVESDGTIHHSPLNAFARRLILERSKITGLLRELVNLAYTPLKSTRVHNWKSYNRGWTEALGPNWKEVMASELAALARTFDYLQQRNVKVAVVLFPMGSWDSELPFQPTYLKKLREICDSAGVKVHDFTKLVDDDDFGDSDHLNPIGIEKFQHAVLGICLDHLQSAGILPADDTSKSP